MKRPRETNRRRLERGRRTLATVLFLFPHVRVEFLIHTILTREWDDEAWPLVREEFKKAMALRSRLRRAGWWWN